MQDRESFRFSDSAIPEMNIGGMEPFRKLQLWIDPEARSGPEAMAVDEWLLETVTLPVLRVYRWKGEWASLGYFGQLASARTVFPGVSLVRRWTGGGMVDHRADWTYTLAIPQSERLAISRGAGSYREIHEILAKVLEREGVESSLSGGSEETGDALCFANPVTYDLLGPHGTKLAGAGQRRSRQGLLHQGSVAMPCPDEEAFRFRSEALAAGLSSHWEPVSPAPDLSDLLRRVSLRYASAEWACRR
jgi:lipoate-protein ligase A